MQDLLIKDVDDAVITSLKQRAGENERTIEDIAKDILARNTIDNSLSSELEERRKEFERWKKHLDEISEEIGPIQSDSTDHIREMRDIR